MEQTRFWSGIRWFWAGRVAEPPAPGVHAVNLTVPVKPWIDDEYPPALVEGGNVVAWDWKKGGKS